MRALLITPNDHHEGFEYVHSGRENLGVEYLLAALRADGHDAQCRNENIPGVSGSEPDWDAFDLVGFSLPFWEYRERYVQAINTVAAETKATIIAGGHASTLGAKYFLGKCPRLLGVVMGEGEETLCELARSIDAGLDAQRVQGIMFRHAYSPRTALKPLDDLVFPARDELRQSLDSETTIKEALVESTRGCTYNCSFCSIPPYYAHAHGRRWRERSVANTCEELTHLIADFAEVNLQTS
jgi:radical SAM superfamily enzyme YgiQ (UPF0313 family)